MQDKIFRVLLILSAVVIPIIGGGIVYSLTADASERSNILVYGILSSPTTG